MNTYLPRLILWLDKFMPSTPVSQKSVGSLCLKPSGRAGFDHPVIRWWMVPDKGVGISLFWGLHNYVTTVVPFVNEAPAYWCLMDKRQKIPFNMVCTCPFCVAMVYGHRQLLFEVLFLIQGGINTLPVHNNGFLYVGLAFSGWVPSNTNFKELPFPHWQRLIFTKIHKWTKTRSWTPADFTVIVKYSTVV